MENASKALLIAAAVLIVILLITFGIRILGTSSNNVDDAAYVVGQEITSKTDDASDIIAGYLVKRYSDTAVNDPYNGYYIDYFTGIEINEKNTYIISFDYIIKEKKPDTIICCGIGMGIDTPNQYKKDFVYQVRYPSQNIGTKNTFTFKLKPNLYRNYIKNKDKKIYLSLRLARTDPPSKFKVDIQNIKIKYKAE